MPAKAATAMSHAQAEQPTISSGSSNLNGNRNRGSHRGQGRVLTESRQRANYTPQPPKPGGSNSEQAVQIAAAILFSPAGRAGSVPPQPPVQPERFILGGPGGFSSSAAPPSSLNGSFWGAREGPKTEPPLAPYSLRMGG